ncbi:PAAR domain-containing protein [Collimonas antrihumi]|uniref:PAAR domain-containing protein n=1 Tax=Collimonas antrihumi TaxID=1940615 RepID=UPI001B8C570E|nr:PAAR domain-containing protein [Collimonas antrihumi]
MVSRAIIRQGDPTSHGGTVIEGHATTTIDGKAIAGLGHMTYCPECKGTFPIIDGVASDTIDGMPTAVEGMKTGCGAYLIATQNTDTIDVDPGYGRGSLSGGLSSLANAGSSASSAGHDYDEQIKFIRGSGVALAGMAYTLTLDDGSKVVGITDAEGKTDRVMTARPRAITRANLQPDAVFCCARQAENSDGGGEGGIDVALNGVKTNADNLGWSLKEHTVEEDVRQLTAGEIEMAKKIFRDSVDYSTVKVHNGAYMVGAGDNAMTPNGEMYFPKDYYQPDYSTGDDSDRIWFIHEMTHVWQYQLGYSVKWAGIKIQIKGGYRYAPSQVVARAYKYDPIADRDKSLSDFNMEQQGDLVSHYFDAVYLSGEGYAPHWQRVQLLPFLQVVLANFLQNPSDTSLLPKTTHFED